MAIAIETSPEDLATLKEMQAGMPRQYAVQLGDFVRTVTGQPPSYLYKPCSYPAYHQDDNYIEGVVVAVYRPFGVLSYEIQYTHYRSDGKLIKQDGTVDCFVNGTCTKNPEEVSIRVVVVATNEWLAEMALLRATVRGVPGVPLIQIGDMVRSFDFPGADRQDCYVDGRVMGLVKIDGYLAYKLRVINRVWRGKSDKRNIAKIEHVFPPVNGTPTWGGRLCTGVTKLEDGE